MKNNYFDCFLFTNNRGCDLIKKKTGIIKPEGEIVKERLFITPEEEKQMCMNVFEKICNNAEECLREHKGNANEN